MLNIEDAFGTAAAKLHPLILWVITDLNVRIKKKKQKRKTAEPRRHKTDDKAIWFIDNLK